LKIQQNETDLSYISFLIFLILGYGRMSFTIMFSGSWGNIFNDSISFSSFYVQYFTSVYQLVHLLSMEHISCSYCNTLTDCFFWLNPVIYTISIY